jgi:zinc protease
MNARRTRRAAGWAVLWLASIGLAHAAGEVKLPPAERAALSNGAQVAIVEKRDTPLVSMTVVVRGGALGDPAGKDGTAALFAELIQKGAGARNAAQFAEAIENAGGMLTAAAGSENLIVNASFLARDADLMLELVADALERPRLAPEEFAKARTLATRSIVAAKDSDPRALMGTYGDAWLFREHPYGRAVDGSEASLARIEPDDVKRYYAEQVGGDRLVISVVGDIDAAAMRGKLEKAFGSWRKAGAAVPSLPAPSPVSQRTVLLVDKPGATQTYFWLGNVGASRTDPDRTVQSVVNTVFGGRFTSMLSTELRINSGLTYGAGSAFDRGTQPGSFSISSYTQTATTTQAIDLALATLDRLHRDGIEAEALASAKQYMLGQFPPTLETNGQIAGRLADLTFYGLGPEDVDQFADRVRAVDAAAVRRTIDKSLPASERLTMVVIGDAAKIRSSLGKYGPVTEMRLADPQFLPRAR